MLYLLLSVVSIYREMIDLFIERTSLMIVNTPYRTTGLSLLQENVDSNLAKIVAGKKGTYFYKE